MRRVAAFALLAALGTAALLRHDAQTSRQTLRTRARLAVAVATQSETRAPDPDCPDPESIGMWSISLWQDHRIRGRVVDRLNNPIAGAQIHYSSGGIDWFGVDFDPRGTSEWHSTADKDGYFLLTHLMPVEYSIRASAGGYASGNATATAGDQSLVITLDRGASVSGRVVHEDGRPARGAKFFGMVCCDRDGRFEFGLTAGPLTLTFEAPGERGSVDLTLAEGEVRNGVEIKLHPIPQSVLHARIRRPDGTPLAHGDTGIFVEPSTTELKHVGDGRWQTRLDLPADNEIEINIYPSAELRIAGWRAKARTQSLKNPKDVEIRLPAPHRVMFRVRGPEHAQVSVRDGYVVERHRRDTICAVTPDYATSYHIEAEGFVSIYNPRWRATAGEVIEATLVRCATVRGRVLEEDGTPAHGATVNGRELDAEGRFELDDIEPGDALLRVHKTIGVLEVDVAHVRVSVSPGATIRVEDIVLPPVRTVIGRVHAPNGKPAGGVQVIALRNGIGTSGYAITRPDGWFRMRLVGRETRLLAWKRGTGIALSMRQATGEPFYVRLQPEPRVLLLRGEDYRSVDFETIDGTPLPWARRGWEDEHHHPGLPPGPLRVRVAYADRADVVQEFVALPGQELTIDGR